MDHIAPPAALEAQWGAGGLGGPMKGKDKGWGPGPGLEDWLKGKSGFGKPAVPRGGAGECWWHARISWSVLKHHRHAPKLPKTH